MLGWLNFVELDESFAFVPRNELRLPRHWHAKDACGIRHLKYGCLHVCSFHSQNAGTHQKTFSNDILNVESLVKYNWGTAKRGQVDM